MANKIKMQTDCGYKMLEHECCAICMRKTIQAKIESLEALIARIKECIQKEEYCDNISKVMWLRMFLTTKEVELAVLSAP